MNSLEKILTPYPLNRSKHDRIIVNVNSAELISPNVLHVMMDASYKIYLKTVRGTKKYLESDIDLLNILYDNKLHPEIFEWRELDPKDCTLLLHEMKTMDSVRNHKKAMYQLARSKHMIQDYTPYKNIDCFYCYGVGTGYAMDYKDIK